MNEMKRVNGLNELNETSERIKWINELNDSIERINKLNDVIEWTWLLGLILLDELNEWI